MEQPLVREGALGMVRSPAPATLVWFRPAVGPGMPARLPFASLLGNWSPRNTHVRTHEPPPFP